MRLTLAATLLALAVVPALAAGDGCGGFAWNLDREQALLARADALRQAAAALIAARIALAPSASLPLAPERSPRRADGRSGSFTLRIAEAGLYRVTLDGEGWIDVVQAGARAKPDAFTGARGCAGVRKSVRFRLEAGEAIVQVSDASAPTIGVAVTREP